MFKRIKADMTDLKELDAEMEKVREDYRIKEVLSIKEANKIRVR